MIETHQFCSFYINKMLFGVEVTRVQEVIRFQEMTSIPKAPKVISGLINLRGQIVVALDMRRRLDMLLDCANPEPMNVVVRTSDGPISLLVDEIGGVIDVESRRFSEPPATLVGPVKEIIQGTYKLEGCLMMILDVDRVVDVTAIECGGA